MYIRSLMFSALALTSSAVLAAPQPETVTNEVDAEAGELRISIQGQGFGAGPDVLFFHDFRGATSGTLVEDTRPLAGSSRVSHRNPTVGSYRETKGFWVANEELGRTVSVAAVLDESHTDVFIAYSVAVPEGRTAPSKSEAESWGGSTWKFTWLLEEDGANNDGGKFDLVLPQQNGDSATLHGNASQFREVGSGSAAHMAAMSDWWTWGDFNHMSGWVRSEASDPSRSQANFAVANKEFGLQSFDTHEGHELLGPAPRVSVINFPGWVRYNNEIDNFQALYGNLYVAGGPNMLARIELTDSSEYERSSYRKLLLPESWSDGEIDTSVLLGEFKYRGPLYIHVFDADGNSSEAGQLACQQCPVMHSN